MATSANAYRTISLSQRPFVGIERFNSVVHSVEVTVNGVSYSEGSIFIEASRWISDPSIHMSVKFDHQALVLALDECQLLAEDLLFVVALRGVLMKETRTIRTEQLSQLNHLDDGFGFTINADDFPLITQDSFAGFQIVYAIVLGRELEPHDLRPSSVGVWLQRGTVSVKPMRSKTKFRTEAMSSEDKQAFGIPTNATTYVSINESIASAEDLDSAATLYLDEKLYLYLNDQGDTLAGKQILLSIAINFFMTLISHAVHRMAPREPDGDTAGFGTLEPSCVLHSILSQVADTCGVTVDFLIEQAEANPQIFRSYLESYYHDLDILLDALRNEIME